MADDRFEPLRLSFLLLGTFDPQFVTDFLGKTPTRTAARREGGPGEPRVARNTWELSRIYPDYYSTDKYIEEFLQEVIGMSIKLYTLRDLVAIEGVLNCVIWFDTKGSSPNIYLSEAAVRSLDDLKISFNVSLYLL